MGEYVKGGCDVLFDYSHRRKDNRFGRKCEYVKYRWDVLFVYPTLPKNDRLKKDLYIKIGWVVLIGYLW